MLKNLAVKIWGNFESSAEIRKFSVLGIIFGLIIGAYWALRPIKDSIFGRVCGTDYTPWAKWGSLIVIVPLVILYGKLLDMYPRHKVFSVLTIIYGVLALIFAYFLAHPVYGLPNTDEDPTRLIGWFWYVFVESFGSLIVALFWAITTDITSDESAKRGFPLIAFFGQLGNIVGPLFLNAHRLGFSNSAPVVVIVAVICFIMAILMYLFMKFTPAHLLVGYQGTDEPKNESKNEPKGEPGFLEGLKLLATQPYLLGIFLVITFYETIVTVFDFHLKAMSKDFIVSQFPAGSPLVEPAHAAYLTNYAVTTGVVAWLCVLFGINNIPRYLGMTTSLMLIPILVGAGVFGLKLFPTLAVAFWIMVISKAVNYALNSPTMKQLYIPTSKDARYKSQAWIEMFGSRGSKAAGSGINFFRGVFRSQYGNVAGISMFLTLSSTISFGLVLLWVFVVMFVSRTYNKAINEKRIVC